MVVVSNFAISVSDIGRRIRSLKSFICIKNFNNKIHRATNISNMSCGASVFSNSLVGLFDVFQRGALVPLIDHITGKFIELVLHCVCKNDRPKTSSLSLSSNLF